MAKESSGYDLVLDVVAPRNRNVRFGPAGINLRGEARIAEISSLNINGAMAKAGGSIPGQRILVDTRQHHVKIIDRMTLPESKSIDRALRELCRTEQYMHAKYGEYLPDYDAGGISDDEWPKWLYAMRRLVDHGRLKIVKGDNLLPKLSEILKLGPVTFYVGNVKSRNEEKPFNVLGPADAAKFEKLEAAGV